MTQIPVSDQGIVAAAPPVTVTAGVQVAIQYPAKAPQSLTWVVVNNSSPFTCVVSQGQVLGQVAAFTADAFPVRSGAPIGVLPFAGAGLVAPGSDATVYATWYQANPGGTYPAAIGSGAVALSQVTSVVTDVNRAIANGAFRNYGPFDTAGFAGLRVNMNNDSAAAVLRFVIFYTDELGNQLGQHSFVVGVPGAGAGIAAVTFPHLGDQFTMTVFNNGGGAGVYDLFVAQTTIPIAQWPVPFAPLIAGSAVVGPGATVTLDDSGNNSSTYVYGGPAMFSMISGAVAFVVDVQYQSITGAWVPNLLTIGNTDMLGTRYNALMMLPAAPIRIRATNNDAAGHTITARLVTDDWRAGG